MPTKYSIGVAPPVLGDSVSLPSGAEHTRSLRARVLNGSMVMLISSGFVGVMNLVYNLALAHALGADRFGHASVVYTVLMLLSAVTLAFQLMCSKFVAKSHSLSEKLAIYRFLHRRACIVGIGVSLLLAYSSPIVSRYLNLPARSYIVMLAGAVVFFIPLGVRRGLMQGMYDFRNLAFNFVLEVVVKVGGAIVLVSAGYGVNGVIAAIVTSIVVAFIFSKPRRGSASSSQTIMPAALGEGIQAIVFFVGQVIINNLDIILVKHFFSATEAGVYTAVALVGRVVYMLSWSVVSGMIPFSAAEASEKQSGRAVLGTALVLVVLIASLFIVGVGIAPSRLWHTVLGGGFPLSGHVSYTSLLVLYAATTGIYSLAVVLMSYEISRKIGNVGWLQLGFSGAIVVGIYLVHDTLHDVILVQTVLMTFLLLLVSIPFLQVQFFQRSRPAIAISPMANAVMKLRPVTEDEAISEFLKSEFYQREFTHYREPFSDLVSRPDLANAQDNKLRKALLYRRRGRLWRELPPDTEWWEIELDPSDLHRIRVFPRNEWRRHAKRDYYLLDVTENIRARIVSRSSDTFVTKLRSLSAELESGQNPGQESGAVLLIGIDETSPLTIIEGNHRMTAAALVSPQEVRLRFRFLCGFSPRMTECCWYRTNLSTLWRYATNTVTYIFENHQMVIDEALRNRPAGDPGDRAGAC
jgi:O-antigen/teichoic acid export membrane protein